MTPRPWGKIFIVLAMSAGIMGLFVWKYMQAMKDKAGAVIGHVPPLLKPLYDVFGESLWLVLGGVATILFLAGGLRAVAGRPSADD